MDIKNYFKQLHVQLAQVIQQYEDHELDPLEFDEHLQQFRQMNDIILEEWVQLEDELTRYEHLQSRSTPYETEQWKQGKAWYDLCLFQEAVPQLEQLVHAYPESDKVRLYLAHAYLATQKMSAAKHEFHFLLHTGSSPKVRDLTAHALGCIEGTLQNYEQALHYFQKIAWQDVHERWKPIFLYNYAQTLYQLGQYEQCLQPFGEYYESHPEDWRGPFMLGKALVQLGDENRGFSFWFEALQHQEEVQLLKAMARQFEHKKYYRIAARCYERIVSLNKYCRDASVWFGLAWNAGLSGQCLQSQETYMKAMCLFPTHIELQISYVWMLLLWDERARAEQKLHKLREIQADHPLVHALTYLVQGEHKEALYYLDQLHDQPVGLKT